MINKTVNINNIKLRIFDQDNDEFEHVRSLCLQEDNWLRENYLPHRCKVTDHKVFWIAYIDDKVWHFSGIKEYTPQVARALNRTYEFPEFRNPRLITHHHDLLANTVIPQIEETLGFEYDFLFFSMQRRKRGYEQKNQRWWELVKKSWTSVAPSWQPYEDGLVQVYPAEVESCYQNIVYKSNNGYSIEDWDPKIITYEEYLEKFHKDN